MKLTTTLIEKARYEGKSRLGKTGKKTWSKHVIRDDVVVGLALRVFPSERKTFVLSYREQGKSRTKTLGEFGPLTLEGAREQAKTLLGALDEPPTPPTEVAATADGKIHRVADLAQAYVDQQLKERGTAAFAQQRLIRLYLIPLLGNVPLSQARPADLSRLRAQLARRYPTNARRLTNLMQDISKWASEQGIWQAYSQANISEDSRRAPQRSSSNREAASTIAAKGGDKLAAEEEAGNTDAHVDSEDSGKAPDAGSERAEETGEESAEHEPPHSDIEVELMRTRQELDGVKRFAQTETLRLREEIGKAELRAGTLGLSVQQLLDELRETESEHESLSSQLQESLQREHSLTQEIAALETAVRVKDAESDRLRTSMQTPLLDGRKPVAVAESVRSARRPNSLPIVGSLMFGVILGALLVLVFRQVPENASGPAQVTTVQPRPSVKARLSDTLEEQPAASSGSGEVAGGESELTEAGALGGSLSVAPDREANSGEEDRGTALPVSEVERAESMAELGREPMGPAKVPELESDRAALAKALHAWATAWSDQNVDEYLAFYSARFTPPGGLSRDEWESQRRSRILWPSRIRLTVGPITWSSVEEDRMRASFSQSYVTENYSDQVLKTLVLAWEEGGWKITDERSE